MLVTFSISDWVLLYLTALLEKCSCLSGFRILSSVFLYYNTPEGSNQPSKDASDLNVCVPPEFKCGNPNAQCEGSPRIQMWKS